MNKIIVVPDLRVAAGAESEQLVTRAMELGRATGWPVTVAIVAPDPDAHRGVLGTMDVEEIVTITTPIRHFDPDVELAAVQALLADGDTGVIMFDGTRRSGQVGAALAASSGLGFASQVRDVRVVDGVIVASRTQYDDQVVIEVEFSDMPLAVLVMDRDRQDAGGEPGRGTPQVRALSVDLPQLRIQVVTPDDILPCRMPTPDI